MLVGWAMRFPDSVVVTSTTRSVNNYRNRKLSSTDDLHSFAAAETKWEKILGVSHLNHRQIFYQPLMSHGQSLYPGGIKHLRCRAQWTDIGRRPSWDNKLFNTQFFTHGSLVPGFVLSRGQLVIRMKVANEVGY